MKLITCFVTVLLATGLHAQNFEGTVTWKMRADITDPAAKKEMQAAQAQMASPEMQAQMREAQAAMQSPEMQEMMKQNPQMRAMLEQKMGALKGVGGMTGGGGGGFDSMFPKGFNLQTKGQRTLVKIEGGMMASEVLTQSDKDASYKLNREAQTYQKLPQSKPTEGPAENFKISRTTETAKILGYNCTKYLVTSQGRQERANYSVWVTSEIKGLDPKKLRGLRVGRESGPNFMSQLDGVPLKMEIATPEANITMEVSAIKKESLADGLFELPADFTETEN